MTIYDYKYDENSPIKQGDIFTHLPYFSFDILVRSAKNNEKPLKDQASEILTEVLEKGNTIQAETIISSTTAILGSQDCDIMSQYDLIFFPLEIISQSEPNKMIGYIRNNILEPTRFFYLPKLLPPESEEIGPFRVNFLYPFIIPYNFIFKNIEKCWIARINNDAKKAFIGKLSHFFSRIPIEEIIFLEVQQIIDYIKHLKKKRERQEFLKKVEEIKKALILCNRKDDIKKIPFDALIS